MGNRFLTSLAATLGLVLTLGVAPLLGQATGQGQKAGFAGSDACMSCHEDTGKAYQATLHSKVGTSCESCHGAGKAHVDSGGDKALIKSPKTLKNPEVTAICTTCHTRGGQTHWAGSMHESHDVSCVNCHSPHPAGRALKAQLRKPQIELCTSCHLQKKAALMRSGHMPMREGKVNCTDCHNPHGSPYERQLLQPTVNENCYTCHADKRGPFLYEHPPVRENCLNCHDAHGSIHDQMLKVKMPLLCQQCHIGTRHPGQLHTLRDRYAFNKGCVDCHPKIHGSTHPTGQRFWR